MLHSFASTFGFFSTLLVMLSLDEEAVFFILAPQPLRARPSEAATVTAGTPTED